MRKLSFSFLLVPAILLSMSFLSNPITLTDLLSSKWISPINDNCFDSLCFESEHSVMYYSCDENLYAELGFKINGDRIEIEAYSTASMEPNSKMILIMDNGVLKQPESQENNFPRNFILVPNGACN